jgi:hypothetical protein
MCSDRKGWPARLVATLTTLAFVFACTFGAYVHAAEHLHHAPRQAAQGTHDHSACARKTAGHVHDAHGHIGHTHIGHHHGELGDAGHGGTHTDKATADCCGLMCHLGHAILAPAAVIPHPALGAPAIQSAAALHGRPPGGLDRPPKPSVRA